LAEIAETVEETILRIARRQAEAEGIPVCTVLRRMQDGIWKALEEAYRLRRYRVAELHMGAYDYVVEVKKKEGCE